ncbi:glycosyltransferase [Burkholderia sp. BE12]|uniref:glycosyltransferase n=1 Tax=Burkholderia sp. BE12 TaxID=2082394 RepID=UPI000CF526B5|nr:glycosyltransferase [Burkholderia sp. BE12]
MSRRRDIAAMALLGASAIGSAALAFAAQAILARALDPDAYGHFVSALTVVTIVAPAVGFGLPMFWLKAYGAEGWGAVRWMPASMRFVCASSLACAGVVALWAWLGVREHDTARLLMWMLPAVLSQSAIELCASRFQLEERFALVGAWQLFQNGVRLGAVLLFAWLHADPRHFAIAYGCIGMVIAAGAWRALQPLRSGRAALAGHGAPPSPAAGDARAALPAVRDVWRGASPFGLASVLYFAYAQCGLFLVSCLMNPRDTAAYSVAVTMLSAIYLLPAVLFQKLLMPRLHRWAASDPVRLRRAFVAGNRWMLVCGIATAIVFAVCAPVLVPLAFGARYRDVVPLLQWMALCAPLRFLTTSASSVMTTRNLIHVRNRRAMAALAGSTLLGLTLIPACGLAGAVTAAIGGEALWAVLSVAAGRRCIGRHEPEGEAGPRVAPARAEPGGVHGRPATAPVSVIIPCYRNGDTLERAVASVYRQTRRPLELILIDDCSLDDTLQRAESLRQRYGSDWIRVIAQPVNGGPGIARNTAWQRATQPYIAFLDADDAWHPEKIAIQYGWMAAHPDAAITGHPVALHTDDTPASEPVAGSPEPVAVSRRRVLFSNRFTPSSVMVRRDVGARFDETKRYAEDYFMLLDLVLVEGGRAYLFRMPLSSVFKAQFGAPTGLSARLWKIQQGEQDNYRYFRQRGAIGRVEWLVFALLSFAKYLRRCVLSGRFA